MNALSGAASIFVVDDSPEFIHVLSMLLTKKGYEVRTASDSYEALRMAEASPPDLFLLDIDMPDMNGYELCRRFKARPALQSIPVIFVSGYDKEISKVEAFKVGAVDYISKPIYADELGARVKAHVELYCLQHSLKQEVASQTRELQDTLTALRILSRQQTDDAAEAGRIILENINTQIIPFAQRLRKTPLDEAQAAIVDVVISSLEKIALPLMSGRDLLELKLTPVEIQVAKMIKEAKKTKEIASVLCLSELTISTHRKNIRKKLGISDRKVSLYTYLSSL